MPATRITMPIFLQHITDVIVCAQESLSLSLMLCTDQTTGGSVSCSTMMNPMQMRMRERLVSTIRQHTPFVLGQKGLGADMVSTARPAFIVFLDLTVLIPLALVMLVPALLTLFPLEQNTNFSTSNVAREVYGEDGTGSGTDRIMNFNVYMKPVSFHLLHCQSPFSLMVINTSDLSAVFGL